LITPSDHHHWRAVATLTQKDVSIVNATALIVFRFERRCTVPRSNDVVTRVENEIILDPVFFSKVRVDVRLEVEIELGLLVLLFAREEVFHV
jgi:hypothetical protein